MSVGRPIQPARGPNQRYQAPERNGPPASVQPMKPTRTIPVMSAAPNAWSKLRVSVEAQNETKVTPSPPMQKSNSAGHDEGFPMAGNSPGNPTNAPRLSR